MDRHPHQDNLALVPQHHAFQNATFYQPNQYQQQAPQFYQQYAQPMTDMSNASMTISQRMDLEVYRPNNGMYQQYQVPVQFPMRPMYIPQSTFQPTAGGYIPVNIYQQAQMYHPYAAYMLHSLNAQNSPMRQMARPMAPPQQLHPNTYAAMRQFQLASNQHLQSAPMAPTPHLVPPGQIGFFRPIRSDVAIPLGAGDQKPEVKKEPTEESKENLKLARPKFVKKIEESPKPKRVKVESKKKKSIKVEQSSSEKFASFSFQRDMFVIRLKDVDSFDRNNEIWRVDNHMLIQKFSGIASLRAPARQFQSTNRLAGYDHRATWRLFIINPKNVEVESYGAEITIHNFPPISVLREAKALAEVKDEEFRAVEQQEHIEKMARNEEKRLFRVAARHRRIIERRKRKYPFSSSTELTDADVCRGIVNELLDTIEKYQEECGSFFSDESEVSSDEEEEDDVGSLHTIPAESDEEYEVVLDLEVFNENEIPAVGLEVTVD